jgi:2-keto-4-pentenoate hydratase/2-oxohepta-3-ene-1,7-dioic acid hydratase in catechol pathway
MKICRFDDHRLGLVENDSVIDVSAALEVLPAVRWPSPAGDALIANWSIVRPAIDRAKTSGVRHKLGDVRLLSPIANPTKVIGIAGNRKNRDAEKLDFGPGVVLNNTRKDADPVRFFLKANSALVGPSEGVALRFLDRRNDPEAEFTAIIGRKGVDIVEADALDYVFGYSIGFDMTLRGSEPPSARKSIDSYAVLGPWIVTADELPDPDNVAFKLLVNGKGLQNSNTNMMAFGIRQIVSQVSAFMTLHPGDVIMAGSPLGFAPTVPGDLLYAEFERIGRMEVRVRAHGG